MVAQGSLKPSCFNACGTRVEKYFTNMDDMEDQSMASTASFSANGSDQAIKMKDQGDDAKAIKFKPVIKNVKIAGKSFGMASTARITFDNDTLGDFFKFVPYAILVNVTDSASEVVPVSASYFAHGNHLRVYIKYPYFNVALIHDPSVGVQQAVTQSPSYIIDVGQSGAAGVQALPAFVGYPTIIGATTAAVLAWLGRSSSLPLPGDTPLSREGKRPFFHLSTPMLVSWIPWKRS